MWRPQNSRIFYPLPLDTFYYSAAYYSAISRIFGIQQNIRFRQIAKFLVSVVLYKTDNRQQSNRSLDHQKSFVHWKLFNHQQIIVDEICPFLSLSQNLFSGVGRAPARACFSGDVFG